MRVESHRFVGREEELRRLSDTLRRAGDGTPGVVVVCGEAGIGKTRLIAEFAQRASLASGHVLLGSCILVLPYAPLVQALRHLEVASGAADGSDDPAVELGRWLSAMGEDTAGSGAGNELAQARLFELLLRLFERLGEDGPVLLVIEDVHWADRSTLDFLTFLVSNLQHQPLAVVVTYRYDELHRGHPVRPWLAELWRNPRVSSIQLQRLRREETLEQLTAILGFTPDPETVDRVFARSEGNAFITEELAAALLVDDDDALPIGLREIVLAKVQGLSRTLQDILALASAAGRRISHELLSRASGVSEDELTRALREAVDRHVLVAELGSYQFRHALIQEVMYGDLLPGELRRVHRTLAETLTEHPALAGSGGAAVHAELAHHWRAAGDLPAALRSTVRAGLAAEAVYGFADALRHFEMAAELWEHVAGAEHIVDFDHAGVLERAAEAARLVGQNERALALTREALQFIDADHEPVRIALLYERMGWYHLSCGDDGPAVDAFDHALALVPPSPPSAARAKVLAAVGRMAMFLACHEQARARCEEAIAVARLVGARVHEGQALRTLGIVTADAGDLATGITHLREALSIAEEVHDAGALAGSYVDLSWQLTVANRMEEAVKVGLEGCEVVRRLGLERLYAPMLDANAAAALFELGRWKEADQLVSAATARGPSGMIEMAVLAESVEITIATGDYERAERQLERAATLCRNVASPLYHRQMLEASAELAIWQGRFDDADAAVGETLKRCVGGDQQRFTGRVIMLGLRALADRAERARARRAETDAGAARAAGSALREQANDMAPNPLDPVTSGLPESASILATCDAEESRLNGSSDARLWATAAARWEQLGRPYPAAYALWRQAEACLEAGGARTDAAPVLRRAHAFAGRLGAKPLRHELELLARRARIDLEEPMEAPPDQAPAKGPSLADRFGVTPREAEVLALLADGCSNRQIAKTLFISEKTVSVHVSRILHKLDVQSRLEAAGIAYRLGLGSSPTPP